MVDGYSRSPTDTAGGTARSGLQRLKKEARLRKDLARQIAKCRYGGEGENQGRSLLAPSGASLLELVEAQQDCPAGALRQTQHLLEMSVL